MKQRKIKFVCDARQWFDKVNGNTYFSCVVTRTRDGKQLKIPFQYGYGSHYQDMTLKAMAKEKWLPVKYRQDKEYYMYERENNYPIQWMMTDSLKRDCINHVK